jgi:hypothetical protein
MHLEEAARSERMAGPRWTWKEPTEECEQWRTWRPGASHLEQNLTQHPQPRRRPARPPSPRATKPPAANTTPSRRGRRRSAAASRSNKMDLGFPLTQKGERSGSDPRTRLQGGSGTRKCHRGPHQQRREKGFHPAGGRTPAERRQEVACIKNTTTEGNLSMRRSTSTTTAGVPNTPRRDQDGPAKAGKVHSGSEQEAPATRDPEEDDGSQPG